MKSKLIVDDRWIGIHGIGRFSTEVLARLPQKFRGVRIASKPSASYDALLLDIYLRQHAARDGLFFSPGYNCPLSRARKSLVTLHDIMHLHQPGPLAPLKRLYYERVVRPTLNSTGFFLTVSDYSAKAICEWAKLAPNSAIVVGNGVSADFSPAATVASSGAPYLLYVGNRLAHKNIERLLLAFASLPKAYGDVRLAMSGRMDQGIASLGIRKDVLDKIDFLGQLDDKQLAKAYQGAIALVIPSLDEGFGLPALEAMACSTAVIAGVAGALPEVVSDAGLPVDPLSVASIMDGMVQVIDNVQMREELGRRGVARAADFSWDQVAKRVASAISNFD